MGQPKGCIPWNKGVKTGLPGGRSCSEGCECSRHTNSGNKDGHICLERCECGRHQGKLRGYQHSDEVRERMSEAHIGIPSPMKGKHYDVDFGIKISDSLKEQWADGRRELTPWSTGPNKAEEKLFELLKPFGFKFVGNRTLIIGRKCPDFWDGGTKLVELFGEHVHPPEDEEFRVNFFKENGYDCLVIWFKELRFPESIIEKVQKFVEV